MQSLAAARNLSFIQTEWLPDHWVTSAIQGQCIINELIFISELIMNKYLLLHIVVHLGVFLL